MIGRLAALILLCRAYLIQGADAARPLSLAVAKVGGNAILQCSATEENQFFQWFKQSPGYLSQELASGQNIREAFKEPHFTVTTNKRDSFLTITNVSKEDEAVYICQTGVGYAQSLNTGIFLAVHDDDQHKCVDLKQSPEAATVTPGDSVNLQCSLFTKNTTEQCPGGHDVHWVRSAKSHPGLIYTVGNSAEQVERSCVYSLSKAVQNSSDAGTYYCAVVTCGKILFGGGTKVDTPAAAEWDPLVLVLGGLLACCGLVIALLILHIHRGKVSKGAVSASQHLGHEDDQSNEQGDEAKAATYTVLDFSGRTVKRSKNRRTEDPTQQECVYSAVRAGYQQQQQLWL